MKVFRKEELENMSNEELMDLVVKSYDIKDFNLLKIDVLKMEPAIKYKSRITKDDLINYFETKQKERKYVFPYVNEELKFTFFGQRIVPAKGFFWKIDARKEKDAFGLVVVDFFIKSVIRNDDTRFESELDKYKEKKYYFYDYENEIYEQVDLNAKNEKTTEYNARREAADYVYERLGSYYEEYIQYLLEEVPKIIAKNQENKDSLSTFELIDDCLIFLRDVKKYIPVKMFFAHVEKYEYDGLIERMNWIENNLLKFKLILEDMLNENADEYVDFTGFFQENEYTKFFNDFVVFMREYFISFFFFETGKSKSFADERGFWKCEDYKLYPTVFEVERRRHFTEKPNRYSQYLTELKDIANNMMKARK